MTMKLVRSVLKESRTVLINDCNLATNLRYQLPLLTYLLTYLQICSQHKRWFTGNLPYSLKQSTRTSLHNSTLERPAC